MSNTTHTNDPFDRLPPLQPQEAPQRKKLTVEERKQLLLQREAHDPDMLRMVELQHQVADLLQEQDAIFKQCFQIVSIRRLEYVLAYPEARLAKYQPWDCKVGELLQTRTSLYRRIK